MTDLSLKAAILCSVLLVPGTLLAQTTTATDTAASTEETAGLMTPEELQTLVGPVALYPDTLLIQILVAATFPFDVMKADRVLKDNPGKTPEELKPLIAIQAWDESVAVLATAFPEVLTEMAVHVDWTETMGNAMLAQSDDVMDAVQVMREIANETGALVSGEEQTVEVTQDNSGDQTIIIQPTDPEVVYVPQYDPEVVYVDNGVDGGDVVAAGMIAFGTYAVMDAIFDNNDPWNNYWGCRNCGGWGGGPIYRNPNIDIDVDGNVNIGNNIGNNNGWKPDDRRKDKARNDIARKRGPEGNNKLPVKRPDRGDEMRASLSKKSGAADISRAKAPRAAVENARPAVNKPANRPSVNRPAGNHSGAVARTGAPAKAKAAVHKPTKARAPAAKAQRSSGGGLSHRASAPKARSGGSRGRAAGGGGRRR